MSNHRTLRAGVRNLAPEALRHRVLPPQDRRNRDRPEERAERQVARHNLALQTWPPQDQGSRLVRAEC